HTRPADGEVGVAPWDGLVVEFLTPMDPQSINHNFSIQPPVTQTEVFTYWWDNNTHLEISFPTEPNTDYAVTLSGEIRDRYGHPLGEDTTIHWSTRGYRPMVDLTVPGRTGTYNAYTSTHVALTVRNLGLVHFALYRMSLDDFLATNGEDQWSAWKKYHGDWEQLIRQWSQEVSPPVNQSRIYSLELTNENGTRLPPGIYYLEVWGDYDSIYPQALPVMGWDDDDIQRHILVVSRYNVSLKTTSSEALVWVTDMRSGDVVPNVPVIVMDEKGHFISEGMTDEDGVFVADEHKPYDMWKPIFAFVGDPEHPDDDFAAHINRWSGGIQPWNFDLPIEEYSQPLSAYFFTDRPIYRPGQEVYFKGVLRYDDDAHYTLPPADQPVRVAIYDAQGTKVYEEKLSLSDMGTLNGALTLEEEAPLGTYHIEASYGKYDFGTSFRVAEYRKPEFQVTVDTDRAEYVQGDTIRVSAQATYFFGGPVANAEVRYAILTNDVYFRYPGPGWWSFADYRDWDWWWEGGAYGELVTEGEGTTDAEGRFTFRVEADITEYLSSQRFTLEVTVTDVNHQQVSNRTDAVIHKGMYYIGMRPQSYVGQVDKESAVEIITVDWAGDPSAGRSLEVTAGKRTWYSVKKQMEDGRYYWESVTEDTPVYTTTVTSDANGEAVVHFTPQEGGVYYVRAVGKDQHGNEIRSATYLWVSDQHYVSWRRENNDRIELVADRREYQVGDTAHILVPHPYQGQVKALVTLERGHIYQHWVQTLETNSDQINIPITEDLIPNVFVSVVIVKGQDETNPSPDFKVGYVELPIVVTEKNLNITMTPDRPADKHYRPGETVTYDVQVTDSRGRPVEAELALNLVDLSVLSLSDQPTSIVDHFWRQRGIGVWTANALTLSGNRVYEQLASEVKGLGGGGGLEEAGTIRRRFPDTAYWNPALRTDENGQATVQVELPDNLTTWRMGARGVTADTLVGQADVDIVSTKDLLVRPVAPRFFVVGDRAELAAIVHNNSNQTLDVSVRFEANRLTIGTASMETPISVSPGEHVEIIWPVTVGDGEETTLLFSAQAVGHPELSDAVEITLPIYHYSTPEVVATVGQLDADGQQVEAVVLPPSYDPTQGELRVQIDPSLAAGMTKGLEYLKHYPYECT
ncbi:MAG TPA: hypothetical protein ENF52_05670, partial [Chloroflexi bacterium]|nr:hypothetical protein [Chloroflexota bacterium]